LGALCVAVLAAVWPVGQALMAVKQERQRH
jgi:hypothetical protein